jgi:hypothetical protein
VSVDAQPSTSSADLIGDVDHLYCCDPDVALCGIDLSTVAEGHEFPDLCTLCMLADLGLCPRCGR